jgi:ABC-2 type transport system permease protein
MSERPPANSALLEQATAFRGGGWRVVARKELADHLQSTRFAVLIGVLGVASAGAVYAASGGIRTIAPVATETVGLFLKLFTVTTDPVPFPFVTFVGFLGPLLGIMFGFDAINGERAQGTLPRLLSHPIHRDEVIIGKFVAGISIIGIMLAALTTLVAAIGILRLGVAPTAADVTRMIIWLAFTVMYVSLWLGLAMLASVAVSRAASSALVSVSIWLMLVLFGAVLAQIAADAIGGQDPVAVAQAQITVSRVSPLTLFDEVTTLLLDPAQRTVGLVTLDQIDRAVGSNLGIAQSLNVVWPQIALTVAITTALFALAFVTFMRQEVRA